MIEVMLDFSFIWYLFVEEVADEGLVSDGFYWHVFSVYGYGSNQGSTLHLLQPKTALTKSYSWFVDKH